MENQGRSSKHILQGWHRPCDHDKANILDYGECIEESHWETGKGVSRKVGEEKSRSVHVHGSRHFDSSFLSTTIFYSIVNIMTNSLRSNSSSPSYETLRASFAEKGYVVIPGLISPEEEDSLRVAAQRVITRTREGKWPHRRVVGRQFPPYGDGEPDSWGVQHVMHPDLDEPAFAAWYTSGALIGAACALLDCEEEELQMGGSSMP
jgi:hypothetical protein